MTSRNHNRQRGVPAKTRRRIIARDRECQLQLVDCTGQADEIDHITNHAEATRLGWPTEDIDSDANLQAVCKPCHAIKTSTEIKAGRQRYEARRRRKPKPHPGLINPT